MVETVQNESYLEELSSTLSELFPAYPEKISGRMPQEVDWDLCNSGLFSENDLMNAYSKATGLSVKEEDDLHETEVAPFPMLSPDFLSFRRCVPWKWDETQMEMLVCDPYDLNSISYFFKRLHNLDVSFSLAQRSIIERLSAKIYSEDRGLEEDEYAEVSGEDEESLRNLASEAKIVRLVNEMFSRAAEREASDIHIEPDEDRLAIRFRIDGILHELMSSPLSQYPAIASRVKLIGGLNIAESRLPQDGRTNIQLGRSDMDVRISTIPTMDGESIVLRILRKDTMDFNLKNVGMGESLRKSFDRLISIPHGIILVVGPTGSGKTTTLYSMMSQLNTPDKKIITIEDPVEYRIGRLSQMQVNPKIGLNFANGLRNIVRQDPDIILVGEIRDRETADIAINAALTGHLVFSTLHTNDAAGAVSRLLDMGVEGFLLSSALYGVLSQRLVRKVCTSCTNGKNPDGAKCRVCGGTGFRGRTGIFELLEVNDEIRSAITRNEDSGTIAEIAKKNGMRPLREDGMAKVEAGVTTLSEITRAVANL